jgi:hypothetical protein
MMRIFVWYPDVVLPFKKIKYMVQKINVFFGLHYRMSTL